MCTLSILDVWFYPKLDCIYKFWSLSYLATNVVGEARATCLDTCIYFQCIWQADRSTNHKQIPPRWQQSFLYSSVTTSLLDSSIILRTLLLSTFHYCSTHGMKTHSYKTKRDSLNSSCIYLYSYVLCWWLYCFVLNFQPSVTAKWLRPRLKSQPRDSVSCLRFLVVFLSCLRQILE
jgi:hypothetical protein